MASSGIPFDQSNFLQVCITIQKDNNIIKRIKTSHKIIDPKAQVIIFGSRARGDAKIESDRDIMILTDYPVLTEIETRANAQKPKTFKRAAILPLASFENNFSGNLTFELKNLYLLIIKRE